MLNKILSSATAPAAKIAFSVLGPVVAKVFWALLYNMLHLAISRAEKRVQEYVESTPGAADDEAFKAYLDNRSQVLTAIDSLYSMAKGKFNG